MKTKHPPRFCPHYLLLAVILVQILLAAATAGAATGKGSSSSLALGESVNPATGPLGSFLNFNITLTNLNPVAASNIVVQDVLPAGLAVTASSTMSGSYSSGDWLVPFLAGGTTANLTLTTRIIGSGTMTNTVLLLTSTPQNTNFAGNTASVSVTGTPVTGLAVQVIQCDSQGRVAGPLAGASVSVVGSVSGMTDATGQWSSTNITAGTYTVTVTNSGFYPVSHTVTIVQNQMPLESFELATNSGPGAPTVFDFGLPQGKYLIPAMPGMVTFSAMVAWNGTPGSVVFTVNGTPVTATLTELGNGLAQAIITVPAPAAIATANELIATAVNGENLTRICNAGAFFEPLPGIISSWYTWLANSITWSSSASSVGTPMISYMYKTNYTIYSNSIPSDSLTLSSTLGVNLAAGFTPTDGTFKGTVGASGTGKISANLPGAAGVKVFAEGNVGLNGTLKLAFAGLNPPAITPGWGVSLTVKDGVKAPAASFIPAVLPAAAPAITFLQSVWGVKSVINSLKLGATLTEGGSLNGVYQNAALGSCFLYTTSLTGKLNAGLELEAAVELGPVMAKVYGGGQGTVAINLCPELAFNSLTLEAYAGVSASAYIFSFDKRYSATLMFGGAASPMFALDNPGLPVTRDFESPASVWEPIGNTLSSWGPADQLIAPVSTTAPGFIKPLTSDNSLSSQSIVVSNVLDSASPSIYADSSETVVLFTLFDATKPWYAATDIGALRQTNGGAWTLSQVTQDSTADFAPKVAGVNTNLLLGAWERIDGDISGTTHPVQVVGDLEIVAAWFDPESGTWSTPIQLTTNSVVDRDPLPVVFGSTQGIVWVENAADDGVGDLTNGDSLMYSQWTGSGWSTPQALWTSGTNGILSFAFVADGSGQGHVVFEVDQDGEQDTVSDRELYTLATAGGVWQPAVQQTFDSVGNSMPVLVAPNGNPVCVWNQGGTLLYTPLNAWNAKPVYAQVTPVTDAPILAGVTMPGGAAVAYAAQSLDGVELYSSFYNAAQDVWTLPQQLTSDTNEESSVALAFDDTNLVTAYEDTQMIYTNVDLVVSNQSVTVSNAPAPGRTDLCVLKYLPGSDAGVLNGSLNLDPPNPAPGTNATVSAVIENFGDVPLQQIPVAFYDGDPQAAGIMIGSLQYVVNLGGGGATQQVSVVWNVPGGNSSHQVFVVVDPGDTLPDRDRSNNTNSLLSVLPQLVVDSTADTEDGPSSTLLVANILNQGVISTGPFTVSWRLGSPDGTEIASSQVGPLAAGQSVPATATWNTSDIPFTSPYAVVYTIADSSNNVVEFDGTNSTYMQMVSVVPSWVPQITGISVTNRSSVQIQFNAANSTPADFVIQGSDSLVAPVSWQAESGATITAVSPGVFQAVVPAQGNMMFYRVQTTSP